MINVYMKVFVNKAKEKQNLKSELGKWHTRNVLIQHVLGPGSNSHFFSINILRALHGLPCYVFNQELL